MAALEIRVPNIGDFADVPVVDVLVAPGDTLRAEDPIVTLESDKATMEVPTPQAGVVESVLVRAGDKVSEGSMLLVLAAEGIAAPPASGPAAASATPAPQSSERQPNGAVALPDESAHSTAAGSQSGRREANERSVEPVSYGVHPASFEDATGAPLPGAAGANGSVHASPSIRRFARELGVDLQAVRGTGPHARVTRDDVQAYVKSALASPPTAGRASGTLFDVPPLPTIDFAKYGPIERVALSRIRKLSGPNLHRNWLAIPHVTNHDEADVTELEAFRKRVNAEHPEAKLTLLAFAIRAVVSALQAFPDVNASLDGDELVLKHYYHIGFAADTPHGLVVPVLKDADRKGLLAIAHETATLAAKAREGKLGAGEMSGASFTISSLGGIGGTAFTPIVNAPEVAILGLSRAAVRPWWDGAAFVARLMLPLSLSYDHRVVDGALAARFNAHVVTVLADLRRAML